jgi:hypothetical protein
MEILGLRGSHVAFDQKNTDSFSYHRVRLEFRKTHGVDADGQAYNLYATPDEPEACPLTAINRWRKYAEGFFGKEGFGDDDYLVTRTTVPNGDPNKGIVRLGAFMTDADFQKILDIVVDECKLLKGRRGRYTTRAPRRGGGMLVFNHKIAQHMYMYHKRRLDWNALVVKYWGGWDKDESVDVLVTYLVEIDLNDYKDVSDHMNPARITDVPEDAFLWAKAVQQELDLKFDRLTLDVEKVNSELF